MSENRINPLAGPTSPTGPVVVPLWIGPLASALGAVALAVSQIAPAHTLAHKLALAVVGIVGVFGPLSAGWRK